MKLLLDTSFIVHLLRAEKAVVDAWEAMAPRARVYLAAVVAFEIDSGLLWRGDRWEEAGWHVAAIDMEVVPLDDHVAHHAAEIRVAMARQGASLGTADALIAGSAAARGLELVTCDARLARVKDVGIPVRLVTP